MDVVIETVPYSFELEFMRASLAYGELRDWVWLKCPPGAAGFPFFGVGAFAALVRC